MDTQTLESRNMLSRSTLNPSFENDEIDLLKLLGILWAEKWLIIGITAAAAVLSLFVAMSRIDIYRAEITLTAADSSQSGGAMAQLGGAAALLGVNFGGNSGDSVSTALATLRSRQFIGRFIDSNDLLVPLFAAQWDKHKQQSIIDESVYNSIEGRWVSESGAPTELQAYRAFSGILSVNGPDRTGIVTVAINWHNPQESAEWTNQLIKALNQEVRARDVNEANSAIAYLRKQLEQTQLVDMQRVFYQLIESQTRITMLADARDEYVLRVIDPAVVPDIKSEPRRSIIAIVGTLVGGLFSLFVVFMRRMFRFFLTPKL